MSLLLLACVGLLPAEPASPLLWSRDGLWVVHVEPTPARDPDAPTPNGLLMDAVTTLTQPRAASRPRKFTLWATRVDGSSAIPLDESEYPFSSPAWSHQGSRLAYVRVAPRDDRKLEYQLVIRQSVGRARVAAAWPLTDSGPLEHLPTHAVAWSSHDAWLALPSPSGRDLLVVTVDEGKLIREIPAARAPAWSPDDLRLAYFKTSLPAGVEWIDLAEETPPRRLIDVDQPERLTPPIWTSDGKGLLVPAVVDDLATGGVRFQVQKVLVATAPAHTIPGPAMLVNVPERGTPILQSAQLAFEPENEQFFYSVTLQDQPACVIVWARMRSSAEVLKRIAPIHPALPVVAIARAPQDLRILLRVHGPAGASPPALLDPASESITLIAPDPATRKQWLQILQFAIARACLELHRDPLRPDQPGPPASLSWLPLPGRLDPSHPTAFALRKLARLGRTLLDQDQGESGSDPAESLAQDHALLEARIVMAALSEDPASALPWLDRWESQLQTPDDSWFALALRAQLHIAASDAPTARSIIQSLKAGRPAPLVRLTDAPAGTRLEPVADPFNLWLDRLLEIADRRSLPPAQPSGPEVELFLQELRGAPTGGFPIPDRPPQPPRPMPLQAPQDAPQSATKPAPVEPDQP
jgi:hypothetical protein